MEIRKLETKDGEAAFSFNATLPPDEAAFFKGELITSPKLEDWARHEGALRLVAVAADGAIVGYSAVIPEHGLSSHVGLMSLVVAPQFRRGGVGLALAHRAIVESFGTMNLRKLCIEVVAQHDGTIGMFQKLGFAPEALLRDHIQAPDGGFRDVILLCHHADDAWSDFLALGIPGEL